MLEILQRRVKRGNFRKRVEKLIDFRVLVIWLLEVSSRGEGRRRGGGGGGKREDKKQII